MGLERPGVIAAPAPVGLQGWINSEPLSVSDFLDKIVLLDFWTYTCVNCVRTLPYLIEWHQKYAGEGLLIIGVHTPEFEFEKINQNVASAVRGLGIEYVVAQDNERQTWQTYRVEAWPTKYIVDGSGFVRYYHRGEGSYADTELVIRYLLEEAGRDLSHIKFSTEPDPVALDGTRATDPEKFLTRELYTGTVRNIDFGGAYVLNEEYYESANMAAQYTDRGQRKNHFLFLQGEWESGAQSLEHAKASPDYKDYIGFRFFANEVNAVLNFTPELPYDFRVTMDGEPIPSRSAGADVQYDQDGNSFVTVDAARMYRLVRQADVSPHELKLKPNDDRFSVFAFTFGAYPKDGE